MAISSFVFKVRSGQVRASCCSARLSREQVPIHLSGRGKKGGGSKEGPPALTSTREYEQSDWNR